MEIQKRCGLSITLEILPGAEVLSEMPCLRQSSRNACPIRRKVLDMKRVPIAICCLVLIAVLVGCTHDHQSFYATRSDAEKNGEFNRGWLPDFLPKSSRSIHLTYDLSPSREWCGFEFNREDAEPLLSSVKPADSAALPIVPIPSPRVRWWPKALEGNLNVKAIQQAGFELYSATRPVSQVQSETLVFAIDRKNGRCYFYGH
jgi:hypothetical protein